MMEEPLSKKAKMASNDDADDDLERLEPMPQSTASTAGTATMNGGGDSSFPPSSSAAAASSQPPQQQQPSVLQELLLANPTCSTSTMNSPRGVAAGFPSHPSVAAPPGSQQPPPNFPSRNAMSGGAGATMMSPPMAQSQMGGRAPQMGGGGPPPQMQQRMPPGGMPAGYPDGMNPHQFPHHQQQQQQQHMMAAAAAAAAAAAGQPGMYGMGGGGQARVGVPPGYAMPPGQGRGQPQSAAAAAAMGRGMMLANGGGAAGGVQRAPPHMGRGQPMMHAAMQQQQQQQQQAGAAQMMGRGGGMMGAGGGGGPQAFDPATGQMMAQREFMNAQQYNGMGGAVPGRPQQQQQPGQPGQQQPQYPVGAGGQQAMMGNPQMMMGGGDPQQQAALNHAQMQQQHAHQMRMMPNGMPRPGVPGHPAQMVQQQQQQQPGGGGGAPQQQQQPGAMPNGQMGGGGGGGGAAAAMGQSAQDPEKRKLIQQQLVLLLHAHKCQQRERHQDGSSRNACTLPHCSTMKEVLQHMTTCNNGRQCNYAHCASSRQIIHHWKNCQREDCPVCRPLKNIQASTPGQGGVGRMSDLGDVGLLITSHPMSSGPPSMPMHPMQQQQLQQQQQQQAAMAAAAAAAQGSRPPPSMPMSMDFGSPGVPVMPLPGSVRQQLLGDYMPNDQPSGAHRNGAGGAGRDIGSWQPPEPPTNNKAWHADVTNDLRHHLVGKLVKAIFPSPDPAAMHDQRIKDLIQYARKVEKDMFENADDREEYYHLLAEKIYKIQKELQEKKQKRLSESRGGGGGGGGNCSSNGGPMYDMGGGAAGGGLGSVKSEIPSAWADAMDTSGAGPSTSGGAGGGASEMMGGGGGMMSNGLQQVKKEEVDDTSSSANGAASTMNGWNGGGSAQVKEEPMSSSSQQQQQQPHSQQPSTSTSAAATPSTSAAAAAGAAASSSAAAGTSTPKKEPAKREPTPPPGAECVFETAELRKYLEPIINELERSDDAVPFKVPVDPMALNIPDYFDIVKQPMDLSTMSDKLTTGIYTNPWQLCDDMWLMFDNAWLYNRKNSKVYKYSTKLSELFIDRINPAMQNLGYCCGQKLSFTPLALFCYGASMCTIGRDQQYWCYEASSSSYGVTVSERYTYCQKCYEGLTDEGISLSENPADKSNMVAKAAFKQLKNNVIELEPFEHCKYCHRKWHKICALHDKKVYPEGFVCPSCRREKKLPMPENKYLAKKLPHCKLSTHLEERVNGYIRGRMPKGAEDHEVVIRVLSVVEKEVEVKPMMKQKYCGDAPAAFPSKFPYKTKAIFAYEMIDGVEVCFFGLHVQEYGSKCPAPNARRVYIAYLDSVHYFQPRALRTDVYHEILLGYLDYAKKLGYTMAHIWACPPSEGDDYIFHCHPTEQKIPKPKRLQDWYKKMLDKGVQEQCVVEYKDIYKQARDDGLTSPADLPYFEGDFWPNVIEDCIREAGSEEAARKKEECDEDGDDEDLFTAGGSGGDNGKKKGNKSKKNNLKKSSAKSKKKAGGMTGNEITDKLFSQLEKHKEVFFTIRLVTAQSALSLTADIEDPDGLMSSELMDGRDTFLTRAREEHWEFSSLRRAKYSTLCLAHALHETDGKGMEYTCNQCDTANAHWHCGTCEDFDLCDNCKGIVQHEHPLEKVKGLIDESGAGGGGGEGGAGGSASRYESIQRCIHSLVHACTCRDANCRRMSCHKMKRVVAHTKMCKKRVNASCPVCKQLIALCCYHAKHCTKEGCQVPFCMNIRQKLMEQKRSLARRADMMMRRRMEGLSQGAGGAAAAAAAASSSSAAAAASAAGGPSSNAGPASAGGSSSMAGGPSSIASHHNMKGGGGGPSTPHNASLSSSSMNHSSPADHRNSKFGGQQMPQQPQQQQAPQPQQQSTYPPSMAAAAAAAQQQQQQQQQQQPQLMGGGMMMGAGGQQYSMGMAGGHPHMMQTGGGKPGGAMMRPGMDAAAMYRAGGGGGAYGAPGGMMGAGAAASQQQQQQQAMNMQHMMRGGGAPHDQAAAAAAAAQQQQQQRMMQQRQQQHQAAAAAAAAAGGQQQQTLQQQQQAAAQHAQWQQQQQYLAAGRAGGGYGAGGPQMGGGGGGMQPNPQHYMNPHYARAAAAAQQQQFAGQMGQQGMMGGQQPPTIKPEEGFR